MCANSFIIPRCAVLVLGSPRCAGHHERDPTQDEDQYSDCDSDGERERASTLKAGRAAADIRSVRSHLT